MTLYKEAELAQKLGISKWTIRRLRIKNGLPYIRIEKLIFYRLPEVEEWFIEQRQSV